MRSVTLPNPPHTRDSRIDVFRGLALLMIFINHLPGTIWENVTSRNFGFSDAAEGFVLMSGIATGLAYGPAFLQGWPKLATALRPWRRALTIWWVHVLVVLCVLAMFAVVFAQPGIEEMAQRRNILRPLTDPNWMLLPLVTLGHQFAYADILPLYIVMMLLAPGLLLLCARWPKAAMVGSLAVWFLVGLFRIRVPTWPTDNGWFFNPLSWQVLFIAGILTGLAIRQGRRLLPVKRWALGLAIGFLVIAALWVQMPVIGAWGGHGLWLLHEYAYVPHVFTSFDKSYVFLPRLLHILALAYVLSALPVVKTIAARPRLQPLALLGRHSLPVFATSTVLSYAAQLIRALYPTTILQDTLLIAIGIALLFAVAHLRDRQRRPKPAPNRAVTG